MIRNLGAFANKTWRFKLAENSSEGSLRKRDSGKITEMFSTAYVDGIDF